MHGECMKKYTCVDFVEFYIFISNVFQEHPAQEASSGPGAATALQDS